MSMYYQRFINEFKTLHMEECADFAHQAIQAELPVSEIQSAIAFIRGAGNLAACVSYFKRRSFKQSAWREIKRDGWMDFPSIIEQMRVDLLNNEKLTDVQKRLVVGEFLVMIESYMVFLAI